MRRPLFFILCLAAILGCLVSKTEWFERIERGDYSSVEAGRYPRRFRIVMPPTGYETIVEQQRKEIERDPGTMTRIAQHFFPEGEGEPASLRFNFSFVGVDEEKRRLILRYFAVIRDPFILAGYQVQFVFQLPSERFEKAYVDQIPLE